MKNLRLKHYVSKLLIIFIMLSIAIPYMTSISRVTYADETDVNMDLEPQPSESVIAKKGSWVIDQINYGGRTNLVVQYRGGMDLLGVSSKSGPRFKINEDYYFRGIYIPLSSNGVDTFTISIRNDDGSVIGPFSMSHEVHDQMSLTNEAVEQDDLTNKTFTYGYSSSSNIPIPKGSYTIEISGVSSAIMDEFNNENGAFLIKGVSKEGYERFKEENKLSDEYGNNEFSLGTLSEEELKDYIPKTEEELSEFNPGVFELQESATLVELVINTYNHGFGAEPGLVTLFNEDGEMVGAYQGVGDYLGNIPNGIWILGLDIPLGEGTYFINVDDPSILSYNESGFPEFYVKFGPPPQYRPDYTGTYTINLDSYKTSTLMGPVTTTESSFSLKQFQLTVLDQGDKMEIIGKYENMPFSQQVDIIEVSEDQVVGTFHISADLSNLPYKAAIGAKVNLIFEYSNSGFPMISINGEGNFSRKASSIRGADENTYDLLGSGSQTSKNLPGYVAAALGAAISAGNIPGPDNAGQAVVGLLFPPLIGVVGHFIQQAIQKKEEIENDIFPGIKKYSLAWYKKKYPNVSDETLAYIIMSDALAHSDEPDDDPFSESDESESSKGFDSSEEDSSDYESSEDGGSVEDDSYGDDSYNESTSDEATTIEDKDQVNENNKPKSDQTSDEEVKDSVAPTEEDKKIDYIPPEELSLPVGENGKMIDYVYDPESGNYINPLSGGEMDLSQFEDAMRNKNPGISEIDIKNMKNDLIEKMTGERPKEINVVTGIRGEVTTYEFDSNKNVWVNQQTGDEFDEETYNRDVKPNLDKDREFVEEQNRKLQSGDNAHDKAVQEMLKKQKQDQYLERLKDKYGTDDTDKIKSIISERNKIETQKSEFWNKVGNVADYGEKISSGIVIASDLIIDTTANMTGPTGRTIRAAYKFTKNTLSSVAENGNNASAWTAGIIKGSADAGSDFIQNPFYKAGTTFVSEAVSSGLTDPDGFNVGFQKGAVEGGYKIVTGLVGDKIGGDGFGDDTTFMNVGKNLVRVAKKSKDGSRIIGKVLTSESAGKFLNKKLKSQLRQTTTKFASTIFDEAIGKPHALDPMKNSIQ